MKKFFLLLTILVGTLTAQASLSPAPSPKGEGDNYAYLTFETTDGAKASVSVEGLTLTISGTTLTVGTQSFTLSNLSKMYFSASDETTGIKPLTISPEGERSEAFPREGLDGVIYDLQGHKVTKEQMRKGVYIVKTNSRTYKMVVR